MAMATVTGKERAAIPPHAKASGLPCRFSVRRECMLIIGILASISIMVIVIELICYTLLIPDPLQKPLKVRPRRKYLGAAAYITAYVLSLLRAPLGLLPYLAKLFIFFVLRIRYESAQSTYFREAINMAGDFVNLGVTMIAIWLVAGPPGL